MILRLLAAILLIGGLVYHLPGMGPHDGRLEMTIFSSSLPITLFYALSTVPAELVIAMVLAYILFQKIRGQEFFRMIYFLPYITPVVASSVVFRAIFSSRATLAGQPGSGMVRPASPKMAVRTASRSMKSSSA